MAKKRTTGIKKVGDREYEIDKIAVIDGKRVHIRRNGFSSVSEARDAIPGIIEAKRKELSVTSSDKTFDALCDEYEDYRGGQAKSQTIEAIHYTIGKHIIPYFTGLRVCEALTYERVSKWYAAKRQSVADSAARKNKVFYMMRQIIDCAWKWHLITSETHQDLMALVENVRLPNQAKKERGVWTYDQERKFLSAIPKDSIDYPMFTLFCYLGCRLGEFQGLQWKCFDEQNAAIVIGQQVVRMNGGSILTNELKTNESYRINQLDEPTLALLLKYRATLNSSKGDEYIFPSPHNPKEPLSRSEFRRRFNHYIELAGVPKIVPHGVRHSKATMLASVCQNAEEVAVGAKFLGHSPSMFMGTYVSQTGVQQTDLIKRLERK